MDYLFGGVSPLVRILVVGIPGFLALLVLLRIIGPRPLSRMQSYDVIFALAVGSTYGRLLTAQDTQLDEALVAFGILAGMHATVAWLARKHPWVAAAVETQPRLLLLRGAPCEEAMREAGVELRELMAAARKHGKGSLEGIGAIVLERDGSLAVLGLDDLGDGSALADVLPDPDLRP
jgi:uncharacterized membrane protein YcaP (DUF421 family)